MSLFTRMFKDELETSPDDVLQITISMVKKYVTTNLCEESAVSFNHSVLLKSLTIYTCSAHYYPDGKFEGAAEAKRWGEILMVTFVTKEPRRKISERTPCFVVV